MKLKSISLGTYGGHATHLKLYVQKDNEENYTEYRADLGVALSFLKNRLSLHDWSKIKPKTKWGYPRLDIKELNDLLEHRVWVY